MTNGMDDDLVFGGFVEDEIGTRRHRHAPDDWIVRASADAGMQQQEIDDGLNAA
jgi:hypothetical protein